MRLAARKTAMGINFVLFWVLAGTVAALAGWWMAARPQALFPRIGVPVASLVLVLAVLVCLLMLGGQDFDEFIAQVHHSILGWC